MKTGECLVSWCEDPLDFGIISKKRDNYTIKRQSSSLKMVLIATDTGDAR